jgi:methionyl-tRNA formyltransferase
MNNMSIPISIILLGKGLNKNGWKPLQDFFTSKNLHCEMHSTHETILQKCTIGILLGYSCIIPASVLNMAKFGFVVFHSSDLPEGRGFAPIYNTITRNMNLTQTLCFASEEVDSGNIIAKVRYALYGDELEDEVRLIDDHLTMCLMKDALYPLLSGQVTGSSQEHHDVSWWSRRRPEESKIDPNLQITKLFDHLRALPATAPAFFEHRGRKYFLHLEASEPLRNFDIKKMTMERHYDY